MSIPRIRLRSHLLAGNPAASPEEVVSHFGAIQAQDYEGALWAIGVRMREAVRHDVERAIEERRIVRCWPMRGTLHFVPAEDARWMLELLAAPVLRRHHPRIAKEFGLTAAELRKAATLVSHALRGGGALMRSEIYAVLDAGGVTTSGGRGLQVIFALAHELLICFGPRRGKQPTFVLLEEWLPQSAPRTREDAIAELARRYAQSHGPATGEDFAWWSGLPMREARDAMAAIAPGRAGAGRRRRSAHLLPPFDEYSVAYKDRSAVLDPMHRRRVNNGGGMINALVVLNGVVEGTWKRTVGRTSVDVAISPFRRLTDEEKSSLAREVARYAAFLGSEGKMRIARA